MCSLCLEEVIAVRDFTPSGSGEAEMNLSELPAEEVIQDGTTKEKSQG